MLHTLSYKLETHDSPISMRKSTPAERGAGFHFFPNTQNAVLVGTVYCSFNERKICNKNDINSFLPVISAADISSGRLGGGH